VNRCLFQAFGEALSAHKGAGRAGRLSRASLGRST
jgi:hypothetical protein